MSNSIPLVEKGDRGIENNNEVEMMKNIRLINLSLMNEKQKRI